MAFAGGGFRAGILVHRVAIEAPSGTRGGDGGTTGAYRTEATGVPALVEEGSVRDVVEARRADGRVSSIVRLRYYPALTGRHRFDFGGRKLNILGAPTNPDGRRIEHLCFCAEATGG